MDEIKTALDTEIAAFKAYADCHCPEQRDADGGIVACSHERAHREAEYQREAAISRYLLTHMGEKKEARP